MAEHQPEAPKPLDQPINLLHYVYLLFDTKWIILGVSVFVGFSTMQYSKTLPEIYEALTKVDIVEPGDPGGADPDNRSLGESTDLIEYGFALNAAKENHAKITLARMRSRKFTRYFLDKHNIYALLYPQKWSSEQQQWKDGFKLDKGKAFIKFSNEMRSIVEDEEAEIVMVKMRHTDPTLAAELANLYVREFNTYMRDLELTEIQAKIDFLTSRLATAEYVQMKQMLYRLIEAEEASLTIVRGEEFFALQVLDPATRVYDRFSPARKKMTITAGAASAFAAIVGVIGLDILRQMKAKLDQYSRNKGRKPLQQRKLSIRGNLIRLVLFLWRKVTARITKPKA